MAGQRRGGTTTITFGDSQTRQVIQVNNNDGGSKHHPKFFYAGNSNLCLVSTNLDKMLIHLNNWHGNEMRTINRTALTLSSAMWDYVAYTNLTDHLNTLRIFLKYPRTKLFWKSHLAFHPYRQKFNCNHFAYYHVPMLYTSRARSAAWNEGHRRVVEEVGNVAWLDFWTVTQVWGMPRTFRIRDTLKYSSIIRFLNGSL
eukprot:scaffold16502_cov177-Amphora_coffeaeformis.AAC.5